jgi:hypothetical protein
MLKTTIIDPLTKSPIRGYGPTAPVLLGQWSLSAAVAEAGARSSAGAIKGEFQSWQIRHYWSAAATGTGTLKLQYRADGKWFMLGAIELTKAPTVANALSQLVVIPAPAGADLVAAVYEDFVDGILYLEVLGVA